MPALRFPKLRRCLALRRTESLLTLCKMTTRILPIVKVLEQTGLSRRTLYSEISEGRFPKPVQLTARRVGWPEADVEDWLAAKIAERNSGVTR